MICSAALRTATTTSSLPAPTADVTFADQTWMQLAGQPRAVRKALKAIARRLPDNEDVKQFISEFDELLEKRTRIVHSVVQFGFEESDGPEFRATEGAPDLGPASPEDSRRV